MRGLIINHRTKYIGQIIKLFVGCDVMDYLNFDPVKCEEYDYIVLSGGPIDITGDNIKEEKIWLSKTEKPIFGICLGFQILCLVFNGNMNKFDKNRKLNEQFNFINENYNMLYNHSYYFNKIPDEFIGEIKNDIVIFIKHKIKPIIAFQGHPEMTEDGYKIRDFFINKMVIKS